MRAVFHLEATPQISPLKHPLKPFPGKRSKPSPESDPFLQNFIIRLFVKTTLSTFNSPKETFQVFFSSTSKLTEKIKTPAKTQRFVFNAGKSREIVFFFSVRIKYNLLY